MKRTCTTLCQKAIKYRYKDFKRTLKEKSTTETKTIGPIRLEFRSIFNKGEKDKKLSKNTFDPNKQRTYEPISYGSFTRSGPKIKHFSKN